MEKHTTDIESFAATVWPIFHYDFTNKEGRRIHTTKWMGDIHQMLIEGTSELLNDEPLFVMKPHNVYYDGKKWVILK